MIFAQSDLRCLLIPQTPAIMAAIVHCGWRHWDASVVVGGIGWWQLMAPMGGKVKNF